MYCPIHSDSCNDCSVEKAKQALPLALFMYLCTTSSFASVQGHNCWHGATWHEDNLERTEVVSSKGMPMRRSRSRGRYQAWNDGIDDQRPSPTQRIQMSRQLHRRLTGSREPTLSIMIGDTCRLQRQPPSHPWHVGCHPSSAAEPYTNGEPCRVLLTLFGREH